MNEPTCAYCGKTATEAFGWLPCDEDETTPAEYAMEDGTYNPKTNRFACDSCYIGIGMPSSSYGWSVDGNLFI